VPTVLKKLQKWGDYESFGQPVWPTKFIPMKTPLSHEILDNWQLPEAPKHRLTVSTLLEAQQAAGRRVGLLLDLSNHGEGRSYLMGARWLVLVCVGRVKHSLQGCIGGCEATTLASRQPFHCLTCVLCPCCLQTACTTQTSRQVSTTCTSSWSPRSCRHSSLCRRWGAQQQRSGQHTLTCTSRCTAHTVR
jgi:hypothetical protein